MRRMSSALSSNDSARSARPDRSAWIVGSLGLISRRYASRLARPWPSSLPRPSRPSAIAVSAALSFSGSSARSSGNRSARTRSTSTASWLLSCGIRSPSRSGSVGRARGRDDEVDELLAEQRLGPDAARRRCAARSRPCPCGSATTASRLAVGSSACATRPTSTPRILTSASLPSWAGGVDDQRRRSPRRGRTILRWNFSTVRPRARPMTTRSASPWRTSPPRRRPHRVTPRSGRCCRRPRRRGERTKLRTTTATIDEADGPAHGHADARRPAGGVVAVVAVDEGDDDGEDHRLDELIDDVDRRQVEAEVVVVDARATGRRTGW